MKPEATDLSLDELSNRVADELRKLGVHEAQRDGRVAAAPDARTIRYYTTLGLIDRPTLAGREARYGERHLLQLLTIKVMQSFSRPLADIQTQLYGRSNRELQAIIASSSRSMAARPRINTAAIRWLEIPIEPGLKLMVQEGSKSTVDMRSLLDRIAAALTSIGRTGASNGGPRS